MDRPDTLPKSEADQSASYCMTDVGTKQTTHRIALASGSISMKPETLARILKKTLPKGDCLALAEISGLLAVKKLPEILPLCHPISLESIQIRCYPDETRSVIHVHCTVSTHSKTGVEMEALAGVQGALLCIYDLCKPFDRFMMIQNIVLEEKRGGKSGTWNRSEDTLAHNPEVGVRTARSEKQWKNLGVSLLTVSDRASSGAYSDQSGVLLKESVEKLGAVVSGQDLVPDEFDLISTRISSWVKEKSPDCILITGGTGAAKRDVTPEVLHNLASKVIPGIGEALRSKGAEHTHYSWLSRSVGVVIHESLVIALPGSPKAVRESIGVLEPLVPHLVKIIRGSQSIH